MFSDARARRAVARFRMRATLMLSAVSPAVRRELIEDLDAHIQDLAAGMPDQGGESNKSAPRSTGWATPATSSRRSSEKRSFAIPRGISAWVRRARRSFTG